MSASPDVDYGRRANDHYEPCGLLQVAQSEIINIKQDIDVLYKRVDRLPNWMVMLWGVTTAALGAAVSAIYFLLDQLSNV